jgi:fructosamine-3-kinase
LGKELHAKGLAIVDRVGGLFVDYRPRASLLHGDLWSGNVGQLADEGTGRLRSRPAIGEIAKPTSP